MSESEPISWRTVIYGTAVLSSDNVQVGTVREVLGSDGEDIFHGLRVTLTGGHRDVMVRGDEVESMSAAEIRTGLAEAEIQALPAYDEHAAYHLASVGWLRKHVGWKRDSRSDEEPG